MFDAIQFLYDATSALSEATTPEEIDQVWKRVIAPASDQIDSKTLAVLYRFYAARQAVAQYRR